MKKILVAGAAVLTAFNVHADVGTFLGVSYGFGSKEGIGITLQATTSRKEDRAIAAAGVTYYPFSAGSKFGIPVGVGYQGRDALGLVSYDVLRNDVSASAGYANTR